MQKRASHSEQARNASHSELALTATRTEEEENLLVELEQLRESTKSALLESWAEVEHLHEENAVFQVREFDLQTELEASKNREELYKMELEKLKNQLRVNIHFFAMTKCCLHIYILPPLKHARMHSLLVKQLLLPMRLLK